jgi:hypothetical protein
VALWTTLKSAAQSHRIVPTDAIATRQKEQRRRHSPGLAGSLLASAGFDGTLRLWKVDGQAPIAQLALGPPVQALAWEYAG